MTGTSCHRAVVCLMPRGNRLFHATWPSFVNDRESRVLASNPLVLHRSRQFCRSLSAVAEAARTQYYGFFSIETTWWHRVAYLSPSSTTLVIPAPQICTLTTTPPASSSPMNLLKPRLSTSKDMYPSFSLRKRRSETAILAWQPRSLSHGGGHVVWRTQTWRLYCSMEYCRIHTSCIFP